MITFAACIAYSNRTDEEAIFICCLLIKILINYFKINLVPMPVHFSFYAFIISVAAMIIVSFITPPHDDKVLDETMTGWYIQK